MPPMLKLGLNEESYDQAVDRLDEAVNEEDKEEEVNRGDDCDKSFYTLFTSKCFNPFTPKLKEYILPAL